MVREGRVFDSLNLKPVFGVGYTVVVLEPGAVASAASSGTTVTVDAGHGFASGDWLIADLDTGSYRRVVSVTSTTLEVNSNLPVAAGQLLVNLGADTGSTAPDYLGSGVTIYTDSDYSTEAVASQVLTSSDGRYRYWHRGIARWELVLDTDQAPLAIYTDTDVPADEDQVSYGIRYAHLFADGGTGTAADPWTTAASNPVQAALDDLEDAGGTVIAIKGYYDMGSADPAVYVPLRTSTTDGRSYIIQGEGQDLTVFNYSGTGSCFQYWQDHTGTPGQSIQSNACTLRGFCVRQTGTARTGNGVWLNYARNWTIEDVNFGTRLADRVAGDNGFEYGLRFDERTSGYQTVDDFITIRNCRFSGNTHAFKAAQQADNLRISNCYFEANPNVSAAQDGVEIQNSNGISIVNSAFLLFSSAVMYGIKLSGDISGATIHGCYMEGCTNGIYLNSTADQDGISITGNLITGSSITAGVGIRAGLTASFDIRGLHIAGNTFANLGASDIGVVMTSDVLGYYMIGNHYETGAGTDVVIAAGSSGVRMEENDDTTSNAWLRIYQNGNTLSNILLASNLVGGTSSPSIYFSPDLALATPYIILRAGLTASAATLTLVNNAGVVVGTWTQAGAMALSSDITCGGNSIRSVAAAVTASTTQTQVGGTALTKDINNISVCANANDTVTLPTAAAGMTITLLNNGAQTLKIYPASGDNLGAGVDTSTTLASGSNRTYVSFDATNWEVQA